MVAMIVLVVGFGLLVWGADKFVEGASALARKMGIPSLIIGLTIVAFGTSAPELAVSVTAGLNQANEIALGNVVGSNIFNLLVVAGSSAIIAPLVMEKDLLYRDWIGSVLGTIFLGVLLVLDGEISRLDGCLLLAGFAVIMGLQVKSAIGDKGRKKEEVEETEKVYGKGIIFFYIVAGLGAIVLGGHLAVDGATSIARTFGISETIIGLTIVAIGTSLPELVTSIVATRRGEHSIAIGNVIGSNLFNVMFILGVSTICNPIPMERTAVLDLVFLVIISVVLWFFAKKEKFGRLLGASMVATYIGYTVWILMR